ncbi:hypothetical protein [Gemmata sp.]
MFGYLTMTVCGVVLLVLGNVVVGSVMLAGAGVWAATSGTGDDDE